QRGDGAARLDAHRGGVLGGDGRAPAAVERPRRRQLDEAGKPDAEVAALAAGAPLLLAPPRVAALVDRELERLEIAAALEDVAEGRRVGELVRADQVAPPDVHRIEAEVARRAVE